MNVDGSARFAFLGKRSNALIPAFVLFETRCERFNLSSEVGFLHQYEGAATLDFGKEFALKPSYKAACEIDNGDLFRTPGAIVRTEGADYLVATASGWRDPSYYDLKTGDHRSEPGGPRVAFASWTLFTAEDEKMPLIELNARQPA
jgi:hypothetical protein